MGVTARPAISVNCMRCGTHSWVGKDWGRMGQRSRMSTDRRLTDVPRVMAAVRHTGVMTPVPIRDFMLSHPSHLGHRLHPTTAG